MNKILVTGATGHFGKAAIDFLLQKNIPASSIAVLARNESKAADLKSKGVEIRIGDYDNVQSLKEALEGIDKVLFVSASDVTNRTKQHENVMTAIKGSKVKHVVYTSFCKDENYKESPVAFIADTHVKTEQWLKESGITYTFLQNNFYMDYIPIFIGEKVLETGIYLPAGEGKVAAATREDMAEAAVNVLMSDNHGNKEYNISNTESYSFSDVAKTLSEISGKILNYFSPSQEEYKKTLSSAGVPEGYVNMFAAFAASIKNGELSKTSGDLEKLLGRKPTSLKTYLQSVYSGKK